MTPRVETEIRDYELYVDGGFVESTSGDRLLSVSPSTGAPWASTPDAGPEDVDRAVESARRALGGEWGKLLPRERGKLLHRVADVIASHAGEMAEIEVRDNGKTIREISGQFAVIPEWWRYYGSLADKIEGRVFPPDRPDHLNYTLIEPVGVVAAVTPWNSPVLQATFKAAPALAAGNTVVIKPSEQTPVSTLELAKLLEEAEVPPGVFNVITGGPRAGERLVGHADVDLVVFTGSDAVGRKVGAAAGAALSDVVLELGGKSPQLVFADADLDAAVVGVLTGICVASGQSCIAGSRVYVHRSVADEFTERLVERFTALRMGDPLEWETELGPVCFQSQLDRITYYCELAQEEGAVLVTGGKRAEREDLRAGLYFEPTIFTNVDNRMRFMREEIFGPVMGVATFEDEEVAVALANDADYGLSAGIWTSDLSRAHRVARAIEAGMVWINTYRVVSYQSPLAGFKNSGVGFENGIEALRHFTRSKNVWIDYSGAVRDPFRI